MTKLPKLFVSRRRSPPRQSLLPFWERRRKLERAFKRGICLLFAVSLAGLIALVPLARFGAKRAVSILRERAVGALGVEGKKISAKSAERRRADEARRVLRGMFAKADEPTRRFLRVSGMAPEDAILGRGNIDQVILLSSRVFHEDDTGRSYRLRAKTRSVWVRGVAFGNQVLPFYLVPDTTAMRLAAKAAHVEILEETVQTTNSWGLRGPEPNFKARVRGIVVGDSFMQGVFVADDETPPERLRHHLERIAKSSVSILNLGHLGYSPDQYEIALNEYIDRFRPQFVVLSVCPNDFGEPEAVLKSGRGDWKEARTRLNAIHYRCRDAVAECLLVPVPWIDQMRLPRESANYPGEIERVAKFLSYDYLDPIEDFIDASLRLARQRERTRLTFPGNPLYNVRLHDHHLSPLGADVWGRAVARRVALRNDIVDPSIRYAPGS